MEFEETVEHVGLAVDAVGVAIIVIGVVGALVVAAVRTLRSTGGPASYRTTRQDIGRSILLGLEILVAGDIIRTVAIDLSFESVGLLAAIVAIRTFLSFTLEVELTSRWPWQSKDDVTAPARRS